MKLYFAVQVDRNGRVLGVRNTYFQLEDAECDKFQAEQELPPDETGWPIWGIIERECEDL